MGDLLPSACVCDGTMYVVECSLSYASEYRSDATMVASGEIGLCSTSLLSGRVGSCAALGSNIDEAQGFLERTFTGGVARAGVFDVAGGAYTVTESGVSVRVST